MLIAVIVFLLANSVVLEAKHRHRHHRYHPHYSRPASPWHNRFGPERHRRINHGKYLGYSRQVAPGVYIGALTYWPADFEVYQDKDPGPEAGIQAKHYYTRWGGRYYFLDD